MVKPRGALRQRIVRRRKIQRDGVLFAAGLLGLFYEAVIGHDSGFATLFVSVLLSPLVLRYDERRRDTNGNGNGGVSK